VCGEGGLRVSGYGNFLIVSQYSPNRSAVKFVNTTSIQAKKWEVLVMASAAPARFNAPEEARRCSSCASRRITEFLGEICLHFPGGLKSLDKPQVLTFPQVVVCLNCGSARFTVPEKELKLIHENQ
jgi:hypothetical protein